MTNFLESMFSRGDTTSTLNISSFDVRVIIEALAQVTNTRIIQEPRVFTADNEEAVFFSGKEVPVPVSNTTDLSGGNSLNTQIDYRDVGVFDNFSGVVVLLFVLVALVGLGVHGPTTDALRVDAVPTAQQPR